MPAPTPIIEPPLSEHQVRTVLVLLRRAIASGQVVLHEQALDAAGAETEEGAAVVAEPDWKAEADTITSTDGTPPVFGIHLYVASQDLERLCGLED